MKLRFAALRDTLQEANRCANWLSERAWNTQVCGQFKIHPLFYKQAWEQFPSQTIIGCIAKVSDSYKLDQKAKRNYRLNASIA